MRSILLSVIFCLISSVSWSDSVSWADLVKDPSDNLTYQRFMPEPFTGVASASPEYPVLGLFEDGLKTGTIEFNQQGLRKSKTEYIYFYENNYLKQSTTCKLSKGRCIKNGEQINYYWPQQLGTKITYKDNQIQKEEMYRGNLLEQVTIYKNGEAQDNPTVTPLEGMAHFFDFTNGQLKSKGNFEDGKAQGLWEDYYDNGQLRNKSNYKDGEQHGLQEFYFSSGQLYGKIIFKDGKQHGLALFYYGNGQLLSKNNYKDGKQHGLKEGYYKNGKLANQDEFRDGKLYKNDQLASGVFEYFFSKDFNIEGGLLKFVETYKDGELHGLRETYHENGQLFLKSNYKDGKLHGLQEFFNIDGSVLSSTKYVNGLSVPD